MNVPLEDPRAINPLACPVCHHERKAADRAPLSKCPNCSVEFSTLRRAAARTVASDEAQPMDRSLMFWAWMLQALTLSVWLVSLSNSRAAEAARSLLMAVGAAWTPYAIARKVARQPRSQVVVLLAAFPFCVVAFLILWVLVSPDLKGLRH